MYTERKINSLEEIEMDEEEIVNDIINNGSMYIGLLESSKVGFFGSKYFKVAGLFIKAESKTVHWVALECNTVYSEKLYSAITFCTNNGYVVKLDTIEELKHFL